MSNKKPLEIFYEVAGTLDNPYLQEWKANGGKTIGYYYSWIPEEILMAAGITPFRLRATGATGMERADKYLSSINCSYARCHLNQVIAGAYNFLDGVIGFNACDHIRREYDNWERLLNKNGKWFYFVDVPQKQGDAQTQRYASQLNRMKSAIEAKFGVVITDEKLNYAIHLQNEIRGLQRKLYEMRMGSVIKVSGADVLTAILAGFSMPKQIYLNLLKEYIAEVEKAEGKPAGKRLMLLGGEFENPELLSIIEGKSANIVTDMIWDGNRSIMYDVPIGSDPIYSLADYNLNIRPQDPRTAGTGKVRFEQIKEVGEKAKVDGYVHVKLALCDQYLFDQDDFNAFAKKNGMPTLRLDTEYILASTGQIKTRVQAFLETL